MTQNTEKNLIRRLIVYLIGVFGTALAIAVSKMTPLGISPNSSLPNVISIILDANLGFITAIVFSCFVIIQWLLLGKDFKLINFIQILLSVIYGIFVNAAVAIVNIVLPPCDTYPMQLLYIVVSGFILGAAIKIYMEPKLMPLPAEGLARAVSIHFNIDFPKAKNVCDITIVSISVILSLIFFHGLNGIREGTIIHAILVGRSVKLSEKLFGDKLRNFLWK